MNSMVFNGLSHFFVLSLLVLATPSFVQASVLDKPSIVASIRPLGLLAKEVAGDYANVVILTEGSYSAHNYQLSVSERALLADANVVLWVGQMLENFLIKPISNRQTSTHKRLITASLLAGLEGAQPVHHHHHDKHHHQESDPHIWLNPINNHLIIDELVRQLSSMAPHYAAHYHRKGNALKQALTELDERLSKQMAALKQRSFIVAHPAYNHFIGRYELAQIDYVTLIPERNAGAKHLYHLRQQKSVRCIFEDLGTPSNAARQLATYLDIPVATLDPLGFEANSIVELIQTIGVELQQCLAEQK